MDILCLCTGNTCRSPMLAALLTRALADAGRGDVTVESAGTGAHLGAPASAGAVAAMARRGIDLAGHRSRAVQGLDAAGFDLVLAMSSGHAAFARSHGVPAARLAVVNAGQGGVPDPYGGDAAGYEACARTLEGFARALVPSLPPAPSPAPDPSAAEPSAASPPADDDGATPAETAARAALDRVHASEPVKPTGKPSALEYADHVQAWIGRLRSRPDLTMRLAARCQHLERWAIPRGSFPMDLPGYHRWRRAVQLRQGERALEILLAAGIDRGVAERVQRLVAKSAPKGDGDAQALEDATCLTFIATELSHFASHHPDYTRDKFIDIIRKTWAKMSPAAHALAATIPLPAALGDLVKAAQRPP